MKNKNTAAGAVCTLLAAALLAGCGSAAQSGVQPSGQIGASSVSAAQSETQQPVMLRVCEVTHSVFYAPQYAAMELGFFEEEGLTVELTNGGGADKVMSAVLSGDIDIGFAGPEAAIYVYNEGKEDYMQVFAQVTQRDGSFLVGRQPEADFAWKNLKGKHILPGRKGGVPYMALEYVLKNEGLDIKNDLTLDNSIQFDLMAGAFTGGTGDYVTAFEPVASTMEQNGQGYIVASVGEAAGEIPYTAYFATKSWLAQNEDIALRFTRALYKGQQWVNSHSAQEVAEAIRPAFAETDTALLVSAIERYKSIGAYAESPVLKQEAFDRLQTVMQSAGELETAAPYDKIVRTDIAQAAMQP